MEVIGIIGLVLFCWIVIRLLDFTISANAKKRKESESKTDFSPSTPKHKSGNEPNRDGIPELIRQQEQTNIHLQKLINDFFWFRIAIILLFVSGGVGAVVTWT